MSAQYSSLGLKGLRCPVRIGCTPGERDKPQTVRFDIEIRFNSLPRACTTDALADTVCYASLATAARQVAEREPFQLLERLVAEVFSAVHSLLPANCALRIRGTKENPPIEGLEGGSTFVLGDWEGAPL